MYSFLAGQILFFTLYLISTIFSTRFRLFEIGRSERNHFLLWMHDFFFFAWNRLLWCGVFFHISIRRLVMRRRKLACYWWFCLSFGKKVILNVNFSYTASAFSVSYSFLYHSVPALSTLWNHIAPFPGFVVSLSRLNYPSLVRLAHTKRSSHKLAASIVVVVVVAVAAVEEDLRNTRCGSFYSADDFYRGVPSPSVRLLRASYSMTSW